MVNTFNSIPLSSFKVEDKFWNHFNNLIRSVVIPYQGKILNDEIPGVAKSHAIENFKLAAQKNETGSCDGEFYGMVFQDSDVAKWLEAAAFSLGNHPDKNLENECDKVIDLLARAQLKDGYLDTYFILKEPGKQFTDLLEAHELYCAGHMMEAAVAYSECTGKNTFLSIMSRTADLLYKHFITDGAPGYSGHPEVELALMKMYRATGNKHYLELTKHFIDVRGVDSTYFEKEAKNRDWTVWHADGRDTVYNQCDKPVRQQKDAAGHAVRAVYLYTAMADLAAETNDNELIDACKTLWQSITQKRMYLTGSIGSAYEGESFTKDYNLPNDTAYAETCASIGLIFFARKMLDLEKDSTYAETMERALYNGVLAGMQADGKKFFYVNPLEVIPGISGEAANQRHVLPTRPGWYACACCPPNVARLIPSLPLYAWDVKNDTIYSYLYLGGKLDLDSASYNKDTKTGTTLTVQTDLPYGNKVLYTFNAPENVTITKKIAIRIPKWSDNYTLHINGVLINTSLSTSGCTYNSGFLYINGPFKNNDSIEIIFEVNVKRIYASSKVSADTGKIALMNGPLVYCFEGFDNDNDVLSLKLLKNSIFNVEYNSLEHQKDLYTDVSIIKTECVKTTVIDTLYTTERPEEKPYKATAIPYYLWGNRGLNQMRVWIPEE